MKLKRSKLRDTLKSLSGNRIFGVAFQYKDNARNRQLGRVGDVREMTCRFNVHKNVKGIKSNKQEDINHNVLTVYDMKNGWRRINLESVFYVRINGIKYQIEDD